MRYKLKGYIKSFDVLINSYYDLPRVFDVNPYIGIGVGYVYHKSKTYNKAMNRRTKHSANRPGVQYMGGFLYDIYCGLQVGVEYRYFHCYKNLHNHDVGLNMCYYF